MGAHRLYQSWRRISRPEIFILGSLLSVTTSIGSGVKRGIIGQCTQKNPFLIQQVSNFVLGFFWKIKLSEKYLHNHGLQPAVQKKKKKMKSILGFYCILVWHWQSILDMANNWSSSIFENNEITITWNGKLMQKSMKLFYEKYAYSTTTMEKR